MFTRLHAVTDADGRPTPRCMTESQVSGDMEAAALPTGSGKR
jgi:hypothetical protein